MQYLRRSTSRRASQQLNLTLDGLSVAGSTKAFPILASFASRGELKPEVCVRPKLGGRRHQASFPAAPSSSYWKHAGVCIDYGISACWP